MSYAVFHIIKANSSLNSIAKHIERTSHPDNADPGRTHLNRYGLVEYPDGITGLAAAVEHRIANAGTFFRWSLLERPLCGGAVCARPCAVLRRQHCRYRMCHEPT